MERKSKIDLKANDGRCGVVNFQYMYLGEMSCEALNINLVNR